MAHEITAICATCHSPYNDDGPTCGCIERMLEKEAEEYYFPTDEPEGEK